jgi:hypothetical protein
MNTSSSADAHHRNNNPKLDLDSIDLYISDQVVIPLNL